MTDLDQIPDQIVWMEFECGRDRPLRASDAIAAGCVTTDDVVPGIAARTAAPAFGDLGPSIRGRVLLRLAALHNLQACRCAAWRDVCL